MRTAPPAAFASQPMADTDAFVEQHQRHVWRYLRLLGAPAADADDLLQDTFVRYLGTRRPEPGAAALLRTIARGLWIDRHRWLRRRRLVRWADEVDAELAEQRVDVRHDDGDRWLDALARCRQTLTERARTALDLAYRDGRGRQEIARELGLSPNTVRNLLASTRDALRTCIEDRLTDDRGEL